MPEISKPLCTIDPGLLDRHRHASSQVRTFEERASRGDRDRFDDALTMVPNSKPSPGDELPGGKRWADVPSETIPL